MGKLNRWATGFAVICAVIVLSVLLAEPKGKPSVDPGFQPKSTQSADLILPKSDTLSFDVQKRENSGPIQQKPRIAVVIDDMGMNWDKVRKASALPAPMTLAFLPYASELQDKASMAQNRGHELFVHLPMEPKGTGVDPGPVALKTGLSGAELERRIAWNLERFSGYVGVNNHMGSAFTENKPAMHALFKRLKSQGLMFLDSRTTAQSQGASLAYDHDLPYAERDVFLDNARAATAVAEQLRKTEAKALRNGTAIAIGHPHDVTLDTLSRWVKDAQNRGFALVPVSEIVKERGTPLWRMALKDNGVQGNVAGSR